jgi:O-succinylbenzoate synthase
MLETGIGRGFLVAMASLPGVKFPNDISASSRSFKEDIVEPEWILNPDGTLSVPKAPGIGVEVKEDMLEKVSVRRERIS